MQLNLTHVGCFAHARRRFFEAIQALPHSERKRETAAHEMVRRIDALYGIETALKALAPAERGELRRERALPLLDALIGRARELQQQTLPSGKLGEALTYLTNSGRGSYAMSRTARSPSTRIWPRTRSARLLSEGATGCSPTW